MVKRWHAETIEGSSGLRSCKESAKGSLRVLILKKSLFLSANRLMPTCGPHKMAKSFFKLLLRVSHWGGNTLSAYNESPTLRESFNKWTSGITEASQSCHQPSSTALIYKHCPRGLSAITNPTGMTKWMAVESDLLKKHRERQAALLQAETDAETLSCLLLIFKGNILLS